MSHADTILAHFRTLQSVRGIVATVTRDAQTLTPTVVLARTDSQGISTREAILVAGVQDILVAASDYTLGEPADGDAFTYEEGGQTVTAEARPPTGQDACFVRWNGAEVFRVHCKIVSRE